MALLSQRLHYSVTSRFLKGGTTQIKVKKFRFLITLSVLAVLTLLTSWLLATIPTVQIDIKPGSDPNSVNCASPNEVITVAILTTDYFDATTVDHTTVTFGGASETHVSQRTGELRRHEEDVDGDGDIDLVFHFRLGETSLTCEAVMGTLSGFTFDGVPFEGYDSIRMLNLITIP